MNVCVLEKRARDRDRDRERKAMLESHKIKLASTIRYGMVRDEDGHLTNFKKGNVDSVAEW